MSKPDRRLSSISRREFLAAGSAGLVAGPLLSTLSGEPIAPDRKAPSPPVLRPVAPKRLSAIPADLYQHVHPEVRFERVELPESQNALPLLHAAGNAFRDSISFLSTPRYKDDFEFGTALYKEFDDFEKEGSLPTGRAGEAVRNWIVSNQPACEWMDQAIARGRVQLPQDYLLNYLDDLDVQTDPGRQFNTLSAFRVLRARLLFEDKDFRRATDDLVQILKLGQMLAEADVFLVHRLKAASVQNRALRLLCALAVEDKLPDADCASWIRDLPKYQPTAESAKRTERVEFCCFFVPELERIPLAPLAELVDTILVRHTCVIQDADTRRMLGVSDDDVRQVQSGVNAILRNHPQPLDKVATVQIASSVTAQMIRDLGNSFYHRRKDIVASLSKEIDAWPRYLRPSESPANFFYGDKSLHPPTPKKLEEAHHALGQIANPLGKLLASDATGFDMLRGSMANSQSQFAATRLVLACRRKVHRDGTLPVRLEELTREQFIDVLPVDPFRGQPFQYSRDRALLWSVGEDGHDDNGDWDFEASPFPTGKDIAWRLPKPKAR